MKHKDFHQDHLEAQKELHILHLAILILASTERVHIRPNASFTDTGLHSIICNCKDWSFNSSHTWLDADRGASEREGRSKNVAISIYFFAKARMKLGASFRFHLFHNLIEESFPQSNLSTMSIQMGGNIRINMWFGKRIDWIHSHCILQFNTIFHIENIFRMMYLSPKHASSLSMIQPIHEGASIVILTTQ